MVELESHDYGGNLTMPWFGKKRPGLDYYLSNLSLFVFIISNITRFGTKHRLLIYDERAAGKDGDALCSLRLFHYMSQYIQQKNRNELHKRARFLFVIMDNCVGQNKSNCVLKFFSLLVVIGLYEGIVLHYLEAGHSHGSPDCGLAHAKRPLNNNDYMVPEEIVQEMNTVEGIDASYIDFRKANDSECSDYIFRTTWDATMSSYFTNLPGKVRNLKCLKVYLYLFVRIYVFLRIFIYY